MRKSRLLMYAMGIAGMATLVGCGSGGPASSYAANQPPTITGNSVITVDEDTVIPLSFTVNDAETPSANLTLTATSSNTSIIPAANIVISGTGANRVVTVTPLPDVVGGAVITVTVSDGGLSASIPVSVTFREVRLDFTAYSRQAFAVPVNGTALTVTREKFNFTGDDDNTFMVYSDLINQ